MSRYLSSPKMLPRSCTAGDCSADCEGGCGCISWWSGHTRCKCRCYPSRFVIANKRKIPFKTYKPRVKITSETKFNICTKDLPMGALAEFLDKYLPNKILIPANVATKNVTICLKNKTFKQIIQRAGLTVKG